MNKQTICIRQVNRVISIPSGIALGIFTGFIFFSISEKTVDYLIAVIFTLTYFVIIGMYYLQVHYYMLDIYPDGTIMYTSNMLKRSSFSISDIGKIERRPLFLEEAYEEMLFYDNEDKIIMKADSAMVNYSKLDEWIENNKLKCVDAIKNPESGRRYQIWYNRKFAQKEVFYQKKNIKSIVNICAYIMMAVTLILLPISNNSIVWLNRIYVIVPLIWFAYFLFFHRIMTFFPPLMKIGFLEKYEWSEKYVMFPIWASVFLIIHHMKHNSSYLMLKGNYGLLYIICLLFLLIVYFVVAWMDIWINHVVIIALIVLYSSSLVQNINLALPDEKTEIVTVTPLLDKEWNEQKEQLIMKVDLDEYGVIEFEVDWDAYGKGNVGENIEVVLIESKLGYTYATIK